MKTNKGFTLVELLAVIVILAIIALIAVPIILGVIEEAEKGAAKASALGYIDAVEKQIMINQMDNDATNDIVDGNYDVSTLNSMGVKVKGKELDDTSTIKIEDGQVTTVDLTVGKYTVTRNAQEDEFVVTTGEGSVDNWVGASSLEANLPIGKDVYINPETRLTCNSYTEDASNTEHTTGCMKWYVYKDNGDGTYQLILDHNTTARVVFSSTGSVLANDTSTWDSSLEIDLIDANDIAAITGNITWPTGGSKFYFDNNLPSASETCKSGNTSGCNYGWLYDRTNPSCRTYGCLTNADSKMTNSNGYWTKTHAASYPNDAWRVNNDGKLNYDNLGSDFFGIRPVITF